MVPNDVNWPQFSPKCPKSLTIAKYFSSMTPTGYVRLLWVMLIISANFGTILGNFGPFLVILVKFFWWFRIRQVWSQIHASYNDYGKEPSNFDMSYLGIPIHISGMITKKKIPFRNLIKNRKCFCFFQKRSLNQIRHIFCSETIPKLKQTTYMHQKKYLNKIQASATQRQNA